MHYITKLLLIIVVLLHRIFSGHGDHLCKLKKTLKYKISALKVRNRRVGFRTLQSYLSLSVRQAHAQIGIL
jgi:hypothetical protein